MEDLIEEYGISHCSGVEKNYEGAYVDELNEVVKSLEEGEISAVIQTDAGYMVTRMDKKNDQENAKKESILMREAGVSQSAAYQEIEKCRKQCQGKIDELQKRLADNGWLYGDDLQWLDKVIGYMQSRRADTIKEALHLVDMEQERERRRKLDEQRHKEIMEELEYQSWEAANARAEQREAAERAEKALRESEAAAERARYDAEMRAYEEAWKEEQHRQNVKWELRKRRDG
jgi:hypothetical protein